MKYFEFIQSCKRRINVMTRCRFSEVSEKYRIDIGISHRKSKGILPRPVKQRDLGLYVHKNQYCVFQKKNRRDSLLNGEEERDRNFKYVKNLLNENNLKQIIRYRLPKHETTHQSENVFLLDLET